MIVQPEGFGNVASGKGLVIAPGGARRLAYDDTTIALTGSQNDWAPTGLDNNEVVRFTLDSHTYVLTGISGGVPGKVVTLMNVTAGFNYLTLSADDALSSAANRMRFGSLTPAIQLMPGESLSLYYDGSTSRWRLLAYAQDPGRFIYRWTMTNADVETTTATSGTGAAATRLGSGGSTAYNLSTGTTTTGYAGVSSSLADFIQNAGTTFRGVALGKIYTPVLSDGTDTYTLRFGLMDSVSGEPTDGSYFRYVHSANSGKFLAVNRTNSSETTGDTGVTAVGENNYAWGIVPRSTSLTDFYIWTADYSGIFAKVTIAGGPGSSRDYGLAYSLIKSAGTTSRTAYAFPITLVGNDW